MGKRWVSELLVVIVTAVCTAIMGALLWRFGTRSDYWGLLVPALFLVFYVSWKSASREQESMSAIPYSVLMILVSALVLVLDLRF
ncbi:MAG: hypothetical protein NTX94_01855 [Caldiserica bacterium]|nr:hypothetical protein [Caldisericota bacterium]